MALTAKESGGSSIAPIEPGVYVGICYGVLDLGTHENRTYGKEEHRVLLQWELPDCRGEFERDGEKVDLPRAISKRYTLSLHEKSNLRRDLESWRGRSFTEQELEGFDLQNVLGTPCQLQINHETTEKGKTFAAVASIMSLPRGAPKPGKTENPLSFFSFEDGGELPETIPEWTRELIQESREWQARRSSHAGTAPPPEAVEEEEEGIPF